VKILRSEGMWRHAVTTRIPALCRVTVSAFWAGRSGYKNSIYIPNRTTSHKITVLTFETDRSSNFITVKWVWCLLVDRGWVSCTSVSHLANPAWPLLCSTQSTRTPLYWNQCHRKCTHRTFSSGDANTKLCCRQNVKPFLLWAHFPFIKTRSELR